jgi:L-lactate utilization protein LutC
MTREAFLARVRAALGRAASPDDPGAPARPPAPPDVDESIVRLEGPGPDVPSRFAANAEAAGMRVHRTVPGDLENVLASILGELAATSAVVSMEEGAAAAAARTAAREAGLRIVEASRGAGLDGQYDVDVGITDVERAIAETGSLVLSSGAEQSRGAFLLPPVHLAIVRAEQVLPDLIDYWRWRRDAHAGPLPAATVIVTGPSKTADIEGILITGVHGPGVVHVVLVE